MLSKKLRVKLDKALLPWRDVVQGLQDDYEIQQNVTLALRTKTRKNSQVIQALSKWVNDIFAPKIGQSLQLPSETWRNVTLPHNPDIRRVGMDWITQQLYQNTDSVFYRHELPPTSNLNDFFSSNYKPFEHTLLMSAGRSWPAAHFTWKCACSNTPCPTNRTRHPIFKIPLNL
ncbi:hypothetical protein AC1031_012763 [Aphanomyces cochlioides]|nr:hypothetical protein AC1031_012763 [Aphanomyces cochlioides]